MRLSRVVQFSFATLWMSASAALAANPQTIHVVFKTHLDVGFTDFADNVVAKYCDQYIPRAIETAKAMKAEGNDRFVWTTGSWIIEECLRRSTPERKAQVEAAIKEGSLVWHAYPFSGVNELMDPGLFRFTLSLAQDLDRKFSRQTISAKLTDVPGETRAVLPLLAERGIRLLHIGINPASTPPATPIFFRWRHTTGAEVLAIVEPTYGSTVAVPDLPVAIHFAFTGDNKGPHTPEQARAVFAELRKKYPGAVVKASTMDDFAREVWPLREKLPLVTAEIGSTWVHSAGTDPQRYADFRALMRLRSHWVSERRFTENDPVLREFSQQLMMIAEHTGGLDEKEHLDFNHWGVGDLAKVRANAGYRDMEKSWQDARAYLARAIAALGDSPLAVEAKRAIEETRPKPFDKAGYVSVKLDEPLRTAHFDVRLDKASGAIVGLTQRNTKVAWVTPERPLGLFWHESFSDADYRRFLGQYLTTTKEWALKDFGKPNIGRAGAVSARRTASVVQALGRDSADGFSLLLQLTIKEIAPTEYGLPREAWLRIDFPARSPEIHYTLQWYGKQAVRLPEAYWFSIALAGCEPNGWQIEKVGEMVAPIDVVSKGARSLHGFDRGVFYRSSKATIAIESLDCPIVAPGTASLLDFNDNVPDLAGGWHFNLFNSKWGTNFPTWYDDDAQFRFILRFQ